MDGWMEGHGLFVSRVGCARQTDAKAWQAKGKCELFGEEVCMDFAIATLAHPIAIAPASLLKERCLKSHAG